MAESLTRQASISNSPTPRRLKEHILNAIPSQLTKTHKVVRRLWIAAAAACIALFILTAVSLIVMKQDGRKNVPPDPRQMTLAIQELRSVYWKVGRDLPTSWPRVIEKPLASEFHNLANDTESAVRFLVACVAVDIADTKGRAVN